MLSERERQIFDHLKKIEDLRNQLSHGFKEYNILLDWQFLKYAQGASLKELEAAIQVDYPPSNKAMLLNALFGGRRHLMNFISANYVIMQNLFTELSSLKDSECFNDIVVDWKRKSSSRLIQRCRNRLQHGKMLREALRYEWRTDAHPKGEGQDIFLSLEESTWDALLEDATVEERKYFGSINTEPAWTLKKLVEDYWLESSELFEKVEESFRAIYQKELKTRKNLEDKLEETEKKLENLGVSRALGN